MENKGNRCFEYLFSNEASEFMSFWFDGNKLMRVTKQLEIKD